MSNRSRKWVVVINNYSEEEEKQIPLLDCRYAVFGKETGEEGTPHLQGFVLFESMKSFRQLKELFPRGHIEKANGTISQNVVYCKKDGDFIEVGTEPQSGNRRKEANAEILNRDLKELVDEGVISIYSVPTIKKAKLILAQEQDSYHHDNTRGEWYYGPPGTGKSRTAMEKYPNAYRKAQNKWFDGYQGEKEIILDDLDTGSLGHLLKIWADRYPCTGEVKGGTVNLVHRTFCVTSNYHPRDLWPDDVQMQRAIIRRFNILEFPGQDEHGLAALLENHC